MRRGYIIRHGLAFLTGAFLSWCLEQWRYSMSAGSRWLFVPYLLLACIAGLVGWAVLIGRRPSRPLGCLYLLGGCLALAVSEPSGLGYLPQFLFEAFAAIGLLALCLYAITKEA
jgi:hypothetical protein